MDQPVQAKPSELIRRYIKLRDSRQEADRKFAEWRKEQYDSAMEDIENSLLEVFNLTGSESIKTKHGTASRKSSVSVTTADGSAFRDYVIETEKWELADWRPNKTQINELVHAGEALPPGVNRSVFATVQIQRPKE